MKPQATELRAVIFDWAGPPSFEVALARVFVEIFRPAVSKSRLPGPRADGAINATISAIFVAARRRALARSSAEPPGRPISTRPRRVLPLQQRRSPAITT
jgi:hypothetical protein